jgi:tripartite-type tricarboxylate transporter receptor subunit TctC
MDRRANAFAEFRAVARHRYIKWAGHAGRAAALRNLPQIGKRASLPKAALLSACCAGLQFLAGTSGCMAADASSVSGAGKQITFYIGTSAGGGYDSYARTLGIFLARHLPGSPTFVFRNMPAGDGMALANLVYNVSSRDGSVLAISPAELYLPEVLSPGKFDYDVRRFGWVGTMSTTTEVLAVLKSSGINSIEDAKRKEAVLGAVGPLGTGSIYPQLSNSFLDTKFRVIHGYPGGSEINLAMASNEVQGRVNQWNSWVAQESNLIDEGKLSYLLQFGPKILDNVPQLSELVSTPKEKAMVRLIDLLQLVGRSVYTSPGVAPATLAMLRKAFDDTMLDPEYIDRMKQQKLDLYHRPGVDLQEDFNRALLSADEVSGDLRAILNIQ